MFSIAHARGAPCVPGCALFARAALLVAVLAVAPVLRPARACDLEWSARFPDGTLDGLVHAMCVFDEDGDGPQPPALFVAGSFTTAGGITVNRVARWDGSSWSALGLGVGNAVFALEVYDADGDGPNPPALYAAGSFTWAGTTVANRIARWDGSNWSAVEGGLNGVAYGLAVFDDDGSGPDPAALYVGGIFGAAGGVDADRIAKWDGNSWSAVGTGLDNYVNTLAGYDADGDGPGLPALYVGGGFTAAGGIPASRIAKWDGTAWSNLKAGTYEPDGVNDIVYDLTVFDADGDGPGLPGLYIAGYFTSAGLISANRVVKWNGSSWAPLGVGTSAQVWSLAVFDRDGDGPLGDALYAGGAFTLAGGASANHIARWDGATWAPLAEGTNDGVRAMSRFDDDGLGPYVPALYVGGSFTTAGGYPSDQIARWGCPLSESPPVIAMQPMSQTVCFGDDATFTVWAWGTLPLSYEWRKDGVDIHHADEASYTVSAAELEDEGDYDVVVTNDFGTVTSDPATLTLGFAPSITQQPQSRELCAGSPVTFAVAATGLDPKTYQWYRDGLVIYGANLPTYSIPSAGAGDTGAYTVVVANACGATVSDSATLLVHLGPVMLEQPQPQEACVGGSVTFHAEAYGMAPLTYQWRKDGSSLPGATGETYSIPAVAPEDAGVYDVVVTSACGWVASTPATLTVRSGPSIDEQPQPQEVCAGAAATFSVSVTGIAPLEYQWRHDGQPISGATGATLAVDPVAPEDAGAYDVVVSSACGSATSESATLGMHTGPVIVQQPQTLSACEGGTATFEVAAEGLPPLAYEWFKDGAAIDGATDSTYTVDPVGPADVGVYDVEVTSPCGRVTSDPAELELGSGPAITQQPQSQEACEGTAVTFEVSAAGVEPLTYQWFKDGGAIDGGTDSAYTIAALAPDDAGQYSVEVSSPCGSITSDPAGLTVDLSPTILVPPQPQDVCLGAPVTFDVVAGGREPLDYEWRKDGQPIDGAKGASYAIAAATPADAGLYDVVVSNVCGQVVSDAAALTVHSGPTILAQPQAQSACEGQPATFQVGASGLEPLSYQWRKDGSEVAGATEATFTLAAVSSSDEGQYDVVVTSACGTTTSAAAALTLSSGPVIVEPPQSHSVCSGAAVEMQVTADGPEPLAYQWQQDGRLIAGATGSSYRLDAAQAADAGSYRVEVANPCGAVTSSAATLAVDVGPIITRQPTSQTACAGDPLSFRVAADGSPPLSYAWRRSGQEIAGATAATYAVGAVSAGDAGEYDVVVSNACGATTSAVARLSVEACAAPPGAPANPTPADGAVAVPIALELRWGAAAAADAYDVYFGTADPPPYAGNTAIRRWALESLAYQTTYHWRVEATNDFGTTPGPLWSFTTAPPPGDDPNDVPDPNDPNQSNQVLPDDVILPGCGGGAACGAGVVPFLSLTLMGLLGVKRCRRGR